MTRRLTYVLLLLLLLSSCERGNYVLKGVYDGAPDGTMLYMSPYRVADLDSLLVPVDSAVVVGGRFEFRGTAGSSDIFFVSSSRIIDGGFVVVEPGKIRLNMAEKTSRSGTEGNEALDRFLNEKEKVVAIRGMCEPGILNAIAPTAELRDSIRNMASLANLVFDMYVSKVIGENIGNCLGHFFLTQSVGVASPDALVGLLGDVPEEMRDIMFESKKLQLDGMLDKKSAMNSYVAHADRSAKETSVGRKYINFELDNVAGGKTLFSDVAASGRYTVLCFWGSWNKSSLQLLKELAGVCSAYKEKGLELVTVSLDANTGDCSDAVLCNNIFGTHLCNPGGGSAEVASAYGVFDLPCIVLVNRSGTIILRTDSIADVSSKLEEIF